MMDESTSKERDISTTDSGIHSVASNKSHIKPSESPLATEDAKTVVETTSQPDNHTDDDEALQKKLEKLTAQNEELLKKNEVHAEREKKMQERIGELEKLNTDLEKLNHTLSRHGLEVCDEQDVLSSEVRSLRYQCQMSGKKLEESEVERKELKECLEHRTAEGDELNSSLNATMQKLEEAVDLAEQFRASAQRSEDDLRKQFRTRQLEMTNDFYNQRMELERESRVARIGLTVEIEAAKREKNEAEQKVETLRTKLIECGCELKASNIECFKKNKEIERLQNDHTQQLELQAQEHTKALKEQEREKHIQFQATLREELRQRKFSTRIMRFFSCTQFNHQLTNNNSLTFPMFTPLST